MRSYNLKKGFLEETAYAIVSASSFCGALLNGLEDFRLDDPSDDDEEKHCQCNHHLEKLSRPKHASGRRESRRGRRGDQEIIFVIAFAGLSVGSLGIRSQWRSLCTTSHR